MQYFEFDGERWTIVISNDSRINFKTIESKSSLLIDEFENKNKIAFWRKNVARIPRFQRKSCIKNSELESLKFKI